MVGLIRDENKTQKTVEPDPYPIKLIIDLDLINVETPHHVAPGTVGRSVGLREGSHSRLSSIFSLCLYEKEKISID